MRNDGPIPQIPPQESERGVITRQCLTKKIKKMVTVVDFKERVNRDGEPFYALILQGGIELVKSQETGNFYATAKRASISSTFDELTCKGLIGQQIPGSIQRVAVDPYEFTVKETGEVITLSHRWVYLKEGESVEQRVLAEHEVEMPL